MNNNFMVEIIYNIYTIIHRNNTKYMYLFFKNNEIQLIEIVSKYVNKCLKFKLKRVLVYTIKQGWP